MKRFQVFLMTGIIFLSGCGHALGEEKNDDYQLSNDESIVVEHSVEVEVNAIEIIREMFEEDLSKKEIDTYVEKNINHLSSEEIDEVVIRLLNRLLVSKLEIENNFSNPIIAEKIGDLFNEETKVYDFSDLSDELMFIEDAMKYGVTFETEDTSLLYSIDEKDFGIYKDKMSNEIVLYLDILVNSYLFYGGSPDTDEEIFKAAIETTKNIDNLLISYDGDLIAYMPLMEKVYSFNYHLVNILTFEDELDISYKNQTRLSQPFISVLDRVRGECGDTIGLTIATGYIDDIKKTDYIVNKSTYEDIKEFIDSQDMKSFFIIYKTFIEIEKNDDSEKRHIPIKSSDRRNSEKAILSYDELVGQIQNEDSILNLFNELENSANSLSSKERDDVYYKILMRSINKSNELNEMLQNAQLHKELESIYDAVSQTYNLNATSSKEVEQYIKELNDNGCILKKEEGQLYCNLDRGTFLKYEDYISEIVREMMLVYIGYNEYQYGAVNDLEVEYLVAFVEMARLEDIIVDEQLNTEYRNGLLELQYNFLRMIMYEVPAQYPRFAVYLNGKGSLPDEIGTFYGALGQQYPDKMFTRIPIMHTYSMMQNNYEHTEFTLILLNTFKNNTDEEKGYIISIYDDLLKENIEKQNALSE